MKALTLTQPWATLVAIGAKRIETRSWSTPYTGPIAIHAAQGFPRTVKELCRESPYADALIAGAFPSRQDVRAWLDALAKLEARVRALPLGAVIATARLVGCEPTDSPLTEAALKECGINEGRFGDFTPGRWAWFLADVRALPEPIPARGSLGLWEWKRGAAPAEASRV